MSFQGFESEAITCISSTVCRGERIKGKELYAFLEGVRGSCTIVWTGRRILRESKVVRKEDILKYVTVLGEQVTERNGNRRQESHRAVLN